MVENTDKYKELGLKVGLEIHQQLDTRKLFSPCPSMLAEDDESFIEISRELLPVEGELGEIDRAALAEKKKNKKYVYRFFDNSCSLVESDEEPPHPMSKEALKIVLQVSKILEANIVDAIQVMRKIVVDGSNTSGFQRTSLVALGGNVDGIGIETICIEEDSAKIVEKTPTKDVYDLSRLGIPLIEIATAPEIKTPEQAKQIASKIGMILRSTKKVKRGLGTIRQDLNVSISGGVRVEIKGVQNLDLIPKIIDIEIERQKNMIKLYDELKSKNIEFDDHIHNLTDSLSNTSSKILRNALDRKGVILGIKLPKHSGFIGREIVPGRRYGTELSDHAKTQGVNGLFHSDELPNYGITSEEVLTIRNILACNEEDAFILIADIEEKAKNAILSVLERAKKLYLEKEVRNAKDDGTSSYMRPMPGKSRMYPETDIPLIIPDISDITVPELIDDKIIRISREYGLNSEHATKIVKSDYEIDYIAKKYPKLDPVFIVTFLIDYPKEIKKRENLSVDPSPIYEKVFHEINSGNLLVDSAKECLIDYAKTGKLNFSKFSAISDEELVSEIEKIVDENKGAPFGALMGIAMKKFRGKAEGKKISEIIKSLI